MKTLFDDIPNLEKREMTEEPEVKITDAVQPESKIRYETSPSHEEVWLRAYLSVAGTMYRAAEADECLLRFKERFGG